MSFIKQYIFIIIIIFLPSYLCQQQTLILSYDEDRNNTSSSLFDETFTTGKLLNSTIIKRKKKWVQRMNMNFHLHTFLSNSSTRILNVRYILCSYRYFYYTIVVEISRTGDYSPSSSIQTYILFINIFLYV
jgi:hypothetical protein